MADGSSDTPARDATSDGEAGEVRAGQGEPAADTAETDAAGDKPAETDAGDKPAETDAASDKPAEPPGDRPARSALRRRWLVIAAGVTAVLVALVVVFTQRRGSPAPPTTASGGSGALIRTPLQPSLPGAPTGIHLGGFVVDGAGLPVAGAEVTAELERGAPDRALASADAGVPGDAGAALAAAPPTGADGHFVVDRLVAGRYRVRVTGAGLLPAEVRYVPVPSDATRIVVARQVAIEGTVTDGGRPVGNAVVGLRGDAIGGTIEQRTNPAGHFAFPNLPEGRYQVYAWQAALAARTVRVARLGAGPFPPVELHLEAAAIVVGRVIDRGEGTGLAAAVELRPSGDDQAPRYVRSGDDGVFRIEGVPSGKWIADAFVPGFVSPGGIELEAGRGVPEIALTRGGIIEGRVVDGAGHPIAGASVRALTGGSNPTELSADVDRDKLRRFSGRTAAPVPITPGATSDDDAQFVARGELGVLAGPIPPIPPPGAHVAQAAVAVDPSLAGEPAALPEDPERAAIWTTGADGVYRIHGLGRAKVTMLGVAAGFAEARSRVVAVEPGERIRNVDLVLTPGTLLVGRVTDQHGAPVIGAQVTATPAGDNGGAQGAALDAFTDDSGNYKLGPVTGTVDLRATAYGHGEARRTLELAAVSGTAPGERREDLVLVVADAVVAGILDDATGATVAGAQIEVVGGVSEGRRAVSAADGTFAIEQLPAGVLRLRIEHPMYPPDEVEVTAGTVHDARVRLRLPLGGGVEGALLDAASGSPLAGVTINGDGPGNASAEASTDKAGRWKLGPLRPGRWRIAIKQPGYLAHSRDVDVAIAGAPGGTSVRDVRLELARGALLGGTVRDGRGQRLAGAHVTISAGAAHCDGDSDAQGEFRIHDCPTGDVAVTGDKGDLRGATRATVRPGDEVLSLSLELR